MATPTIASITPEIGLTSGDTLVEIAGTNFRMPPPPPVMAGRRGPLPAPPPTVRVLFDDAPATHVQVVSTSLIRCRTPIHTPDRFDSEGLPIASGIAALVVTNLADDGAAIPGETATLPGAYTFLRPRLDGRGAWNRTLVGFLEHLRICVTENVKLNPSVDYDENTGDPIGFVDFAKLPGIAVQEVRWVDSPRESTAEEEEVKVAPTTILVRRPPVRSDMVATLQLVSDNEGELVNLSEMLTTTLKKASRFRLPGDPVDPTRLPDMSYQIFMSGDGITLRGRLGATNIQIAECSVVVLGITSSDVPGAPMTGVAATPEGMPHEATRAVTRTAETISVTGTRRGR